MNHRTKPWCAALLLSTTAIAACKTRRADEAALLGNVVREESSVPERLYHIGTLRYLRPYDDREASFTTEEWDAVPSTKGRYANYRRGFYLSQHPAYNERYGAYDVGRPRDESPWLLTVVLSEECRLQHRELQFAKDLAKSAAFEEWYEAQPGHGPVSDYEQKCSSGEFFHDKARDSECSTIVTSYYVDREIWVVRDDAWKDSGFWIARDPRCIASLKATPESVIEAMASVPELWNEAPFTSNKSRQEGGTDRHGPTKTLTAILLRALAEAETIDPQHLAKIRQEASTSDISFAKTYVPKLIDQAEACLAAQEKKHYQTTLNRYFFLDFDISYRTKKRFETHLDELLSDGGKALQPVCKEGVARPRIATDAPQEAQKPAPQEAPTAQSGEFKPKWYRLNYSTRHYGASPSALPDGIKMRNELMERAASLFAEVDGEGQCWTAEREHPHVVYCRADSERAVSMVKKDLDDDDVFWKIHGVPEPAGEVREKIDF